MSKSARGPKTATIAGLATLGALLVLAALAPAASLAFERSFTSQLKTISAVGSTVPGGIGDVNPYGVAVVPASIGSLVRDDVLVSNFNDSENKQGTGTTIVQLSPGGNLSLFAHIEAATLPGSCPGGVGLTTALAVLPGGFVVVGSLPAENGEAENAKAGCLIVLNSAGHVVETFAGGPIDGPWDMTSVSEGTFSTLFVTNVLNGTVEGGETPTDGGTVVRIELNTLPGQAPKITSERVIADGFPERTSSEALVVGPTGVGLGLEGTLYVADTQGNRIAAVPNALFRGTALHDAGITVARGGFLNGPLGLAIAPDDGILSANGGDGNIVETTPFGAEFQPLETEAGAGGLFGLAIAPNKRDVYFVNDAENTLELAH